MTTRAAGAAAAITLMAVTIQLIGASPIALESRVILRRIAAILSRAAQCPAGIEVALHGASATHFGENGHRNRKKAMSRLRRLAIALLAAATVAVGSLAVPPAASAMPMSCAQRYQLAYS